jgi:hypothetical protein
VNRRAGKVKVRMEKEEAKLCSDEQTRAFQHGFMVGFMNGARATSEAVTAAIEKGVSLTIEQNRATHAYCDHHCRSPICINFRPGSTDFCSPECEAADQTWRAQNRSRLQ